MVDTGILRECGQFRRYRERDRLHITTCHDIVIYCDATIPLHRAGRSEMSEIKTKRRHIRRYYELGAALRDIRRQQGLTQAELAERAGTSRRWVCDTENGKVPLGIKLLCQLIYQLGYQIELVPATEPKIDLDAHIQVLTKSAQ